MIFFIVDVSSTYKALKTQDRRWLYRSNGDVEGELVRWALRLSAFTTGRVGEAEAGGTNEAFRSDRTAPSANCHLRQEADLRFRVPYAFLRSEERKGGNGNATSPGAEKMAYYREGHSFGFPHWLKLQHR